MIEGRKFSFDISSPLCSFHWIAGIIKDKLIENWVKSLWAIFLLLVNMLSGQKSSNRSIFLEVFLPHIFI